MERLLTVLLIRRDQVTSISRLVGEIWGDEPPKRAVPALHVYISQLRKFLARPGRTRNPIVTRHPGYVLHLGDDDETDLQDFQGLVDAGRAHAKARRHHEAAQFFRDALDLWRGPVADDFGAGPITRGFVVWLEELRLGSTEAMVTSGLVTGQHHELIPFLHSAVSEYPLNEVFYQQLMFALYRCGRRGEALKVYQLARNTLRLELGLDPCRALNELQQRILGADDVVDGFWDYPELIPHPRGVVLKPIV